MTGEVEQLRAEVERLVYLHRLDHALADQREVELELWRQVFGPATLAQLEHLAGSVHCNCNPVCGHEEEYCAEYDRLAG